jgi:serine/threonine-protein kinase HipA
MVVNVLAKEAGLNAADGQVKKFNSKHHSFLSKRFDRVRGNGRIHFASAMTLLGYSDGAEGVSYLNLAEFIMRNGANVNEDLEELWRRIVFYISVRNTDDHLRNHGFLLTPKGWILSPAFDINPVYHGRGLTLNISETDNALDFDLARSVAKYFRVSGDKATTIISQVEQAANKWQKVAKSYKLPVREQDLMAQAFEKSTP